MDTLSEDRSWAEEKSIEGMDDVQFHSSTRGYARDQRVQLIVDQVQTTRTKGVSAPTKSKRYNTIS